MKNPRPSRLARLCGTPWRVAPILSVIFALHAIIQPVAGQTLDQAIRVGGTGYDAGEDIDLDASGNSYVTGRFSGAADFDPGAGTFNLTSAGGEDVFVAKYSTAGQLQWAFGIGETGTDLGHGIGLDGNGHIYVSGRFTGTVDFNPQGTFNLTSAGGLDNFVAKYTVDGTFLWAIRYGGLEDDAGEDHAVDPAGNVYVTGGIQGTVDFDPGPGVTEFTSSGDLDIYRAKYDPNGSLVWAYVAPASTNDNQRGFRLVSDAVGYTYITGWFKNSPQVDNVGGGTITSNGESDAWIGKFDPAGNYLWAFNLGAGARDLGLAIAVDNAGNTIGGGFIKNTVDFDPGPGVFNLPGNSLNNGYLAKYDSNGALVWAFLLENVSSSGSTQIFNIGVDADNNYYVAGFLQGTIDFDPVGTFQLTGTGPNDGFLAKYNEAGQLQWAFKMGGANNDFAQGVDNTADGSIITVTGRFQGTADFDPVGTINLTSAGVDDLFIAQYRQEGTNQAPVASFTTAPGIGELDLFVDGTASSDPDGAVVDWDWDFGDGATAMSDHTTHTYAAAGVYTISLTVTDDLGETGSSSQSVTVGNPLPTAAFTATPLVGTRTFDLDGSASSDNGAIASWDWDFGDGSAGSGETVSHSYAEDGTYTVTLTVTDDEGATDTESQEVTVVDGALPPTASFTATQTAGTLDVVFDASASTDSDGTVISWVWDFGDGQVGVGEQTTHSFAVAGTYTVSLTVTDDEGLTDAESSDVAVIEPGSDGPFLEVGGLAVFEAEHFHANIARGSHEWVEDTGNAGFSGESAMETTPDNGTQIKTNATTTSPELSFNVDFTTSGTYYIWGRIWAPNKNGNSVYVGFDGTLNANTDLFQTATYGAWVWAEFQASGASASHTFGSAGVHTIHFWLRKDGLLLDKVVLTADPDFVPTGNGPDESPRGPSAPAWSGAAGRFPTPGPQVAADAHPTGMPTTFALESIYPNPFNPSTTVRFALAADAHVRMTVYDTTGRIVATLVDGVFAAGRHEAHWDGGHERGGIAASGLYLIRFTAGATASTHPVVLMK
jgi:PKD repeat protein